jgi:hypothetical protein
MKRATSLDGRRPGRAGDRGRARDREREREREMGKKGWVRPEEKGAREKKMRRIPRTRGRPVRLVLDLKPREYPPPSLFFIFTSFPPSASTRIPPAAVTRSFPLGRHRHRDRFYSAFKGVACYRPGGCDAPLPAFIFTLASFPLIGPARPVLPRRAAPRR